MATTSIRIEVGKSSALFIDNRTARFPFLKDSYVIAHRYVVDEDFTSGDKIRLELDGCQSVLFAVAKTPSSTLLTIVEADLATDLGDPTRQGISLTLGASTTDVEVLVIYSV